MAEERSVSPGVVPGAGMTMLTHLPRETGYRSAHPCPRDPAALFDSLAKKKQVTPAQ